MIKIYKFELPKNKDDIKYYGWVIKIGWFKFERFGMKNHFMWRLELSNWNES